jgi:hypothetical protein
MSKQLGAEITCKNCQHRSPMNLYRSLWLEYLGNRKMIFDDSVNVFVCSRCGTMEKLAFPLLCTNVKRQIAVWYEPYHDEQVDKDIEDYKKHTGANSFLAKAPRIKDWKAFKQKIIELELTGTATGEPASHSPEMQKTFSGFIDSIWRQ